VAHASRGHSIMGAQLRALKSERGTTLIETVIATSLLLVVMIGLLGMAALATVYTENHGHLEARTTEYAQDKMEQLLALVFTDSANNTVVFPATPTGGTGMAIGGSADTAAAVDGYVDWLKQDGSLLGGGTTPPAEWFYERVWEISWPDPLNHAVKQITVTATVKSAVGNALVPKSTVIALKSSRF
jgi:Tfp pilus assembly protein PilV